MNYFSRKSVLLLLIILSAGFLSIYIGRKWQRPGAGGGGGGSQQTMRQLPPDVETVVEGYRYSETGEDITIAISGKRIVRRGRKVLGLRSNAVKTNFLEDIQGRLSTRKGTMEFAAADAEWDADSARPFILKKHVTISIDGKPLPPVEKGSIFFKQRLLVTTADGKQSEHHF